MAVSLCSPNFQSLFQMIFRTYFHEHYVVLPTVSATKNSFIFVLLVAWKRSLSPSVSHIQFDCAKSFRISYFTLNLMLLAWLALARCLSVFCPLFFPLQRFISFSFTDTHIHLTVKALLYRATIFSSSLAKFKFSFSLYTPRPVDINALPSHPPTDLT